MPSTLAAISNPLKIPLKRGLKGFEGGQAVLGVPQPALNFLPRCKLGKCSFTVDTVVVSNTFQRRDYVVYLVALRRY